MKVASSKKLIHNTLLNVTGHLISAIINFFLVRFFLGALGEEQYGIWIVIGSIFSYRFMMSMGLNSAINRYIPVYLAVNNDKGIQKVISTSIFFYAALSTVLIVSSLIIYHYIDHLLTISPGLENVTGTLVLLVGFCFALAMPLQYCSAVLSGLQRYGLINLTVLFFLVVRTILLVILLSYGYGLITLALIFGGSELLIRIAQFAIVKKLMPHISISPRSLDFKLLKEMLFYGVNSLFYSIGSLIIYKACDIIIGIFMTSAHVARFYVAAAAVLLLSQLVQTFTRAVKPAVSDFDARDEKANIREVAFLSQKYVLLLLIPSVCFLVCMGRSFLSVWVGDKFPQESVIGEIQLVMTILVIGHSLRLSQHSNFIVLVGMGEHKLFGILSAFSAILCIVLAIVSLQVFDMGLIGVAYSVFISMAITSGLVLQIYFNVKMRISVKDSIKRVWSPAFLGTLPAMTTIIVWWRLAPPGSWLQIGAVVAVAAILTFAGSWFLSFSSRERERFISVLAPLRSGI